MLLGKLVNLLRRHATEAEHANLVRDVVPRSLRRLLLKVLAQLPAHVDDAIRHALHLLEPLRLELRVGQHGVYERRAVQRRIAVHRPRDRLHLAFDRHLLRLVGAHDGEAPDALSVQPHVLRVALAARDVVSVVEEDFDGGAITLAVS